MSNSINPQIETLETPETQPVQQYPSNNSPETQEWETIARSWLSTLPKDKTLDTSDVEAWLESNHSSLPDQVKLMPLTELRERLTSVLNSRTLSNEGKDGNQLDHSQARFQRTDQWLPIYTWLESLEADEVIKSKDILDWLTENSEVREDLYSRHSRYHLMHYIKKCHVKILKRKERKKGFPATNKTTTLTLVHENVETKPPASLPSASRVSNLPTDSEMYLAKRTEAFQKFEILVEMEKQLSTLFPKREVANMLEGT